ncbi:MAG: hypothetical protein RL757_265 [Bacteroidota bacterium]|jgi:hypothetical protein
MLEFKLLDAAIWLAMVGLAGVLLNWVLTKYVQQKHAADLQLQAQKEAYETKQAAQQSKEKQSQILPIRLQAYERLLIFCERVNLPNLVARLRTEGATANDLRLAMLIAIQQEFEHNVTQQIYVSADLWNILKTARDHTAEIINYVSAKVPADAPSVEFIKALGEFLNTSQGDSLATAQQAISAEAAQLMNI